MHYFRTATSSAFAESGATPENLEPFRAYLVEKYKNVTRALEQTWQGGHIGVNTSYNGYGQGGNSKNVGVVRLVYHISIPAEKVVILSNGRVPDKFNDLSRPDIFEFGFLEPMGDEGEITFLGVVPRDYVTIEVMPYDDAGKIKPQIDPLPQNETTEAMQRRIISRINNIFNTQSEDPFYLRAALHSITLTISNIQVLKAVIQRLKTEIEKNKQDLESRNARFAQSALYNLERWSVHADVSKQIHEFLAQMGYYHYENSDVNYIKTLTAEAVSEEQLAASSPVVYSGTRDMVGNLPGQIGKNIGTDSMPIIKWLEGVYGLHEGLLYSFYHNQAHNLGTADIFSYFLKDLGISDRDIRVGILAALMHDFHSRIPEGDKGIPAYVLESLLQLRDLMGIEDYPGPANEKISTSYKERISEDLKKEFRQIISKLFPGENIENVYKEIEVMIMRTDYASDVASPKEYYRNAAAEIRQRMDAYLNELKEWGNLGRAAEIINSGYKTLEGNAALEKDGVASVWLKRQKEIELGYLNALDLNEIKPERRKLIHIMSLLLEIADQTSFYDLLIAEAIKNEIVPGLQKEGVVASPEGSYKFFFVPQFLGKPEVMAALKTLPVEYRRNFVNTMEYFAGLGKALKDWDAIKGDVCYKLGLESTNLSAEEKTASSPIVNLSELLSRDLNGSVSNFIQWLDGLLLGDNRILSEEELRTFAQELGISEYKAGTIIQRAKRMAQNAYRFSESLPKDGKANVFLFRDAFALYSAERIKGRTPYAFYLSKATFKKFANSDIAEAIIPFMFNEIKKDMLYGLSDQIPPEALPEFKLRFFNLLSALIEGKEIEKEEYKQFLPFANNLRLAAQRLQEYLASTGLNIESVQKNGVRFIDTTLQGSLVLFMEGIINIELQKQGLSAAQAQSKTDSYMYFSRLSPAMSFSSSLDEARGVESFSYPIEFKGIGSQGVPEVTESKGSKGEFLFQTIALRNQLLQQHSSASSPVEAPVSSPMNRNSYVSMPLDVTFARLLKWLRSPAQTRTTALQEGIVEIDLMSDLLSPRGSELADAVLQGQTVIINLTKVPNNDYTIVRRQFRDLAMYFNGFFRTKYFQGSETTLDHIFDLLKNAFVHGNQLHFELPIILHFDLDARTIAVGDMHMEQEEGVVEAAKRAGLGGFGFGTAPLIPDPVWAYERHEVPSSEFGVLGTLATFSLLHRALPPNSNILSTASSPVEERDFSVHVAILKTLLDYISVYPMNISAEDLFSGKILNVGLETNSGTGELREENITTYLYSQGKDVVGLDPHPGLAQKFAGKGQFVSGVVQKMIFNDNAFDTVVSVGLFNPEMFDLNEMHKQGLLNLADFYNQAAKEIRRVLKNKGVLLISIGPASQASDNNKFTNAFRAAGFDILELSHGCFVLTNNKPDSLPTTKESASSPIIDTQMIKDLKKLEGLEIKQNGETYKFEIQNRNNTNWDRVVVLKNERGEEIGFFELSTKSFGFFNAQYVKITNKAYLGRGFARLILNEVRKVFPDGKTITTEIASEESLEELVKGKPLTSTRIVKLFESVGWEFTEGGYYDGLGVYHSEPFGEFMGDDIQRKEKGMVVVKFKARSVQPYLPGFAPGEIDEESSSPVTPDAKGGIDFRALPITTQPLMNTQLGNMPAPRPLVSINLDESWGQIQNMLKAEIIPSSERIKEYLQACCGKKDMDQEMDKVLACIADILRLQEERAISTDLSLKEMLGLLESDKSGNEMQFVLAKITVPEEEPLMIAQ
jgi:SAM-dependent methyltransferase